MPRVRVTLPDELLQHAATMAQQLGKPIDELCVEAIEGYVKAHKDASAGSMRSRRAFVPRGSPQISIQIPEELLKRADKVAKRLDKRRDVLYSEALTRYVLAKVPSGDSAFDQGHDLPSGAWRPKVRPAQTTDPS
jgi:metal-responsive CopG/Arc/MetJ family transcriptional regulator